MEFCKSVHNPQDESSKPLPRLFFTKRILEGNVTVHARCHASFQSEEDQHTSVVGITDQTDDAVETCLPTGLPKSGWSFAQGFFDRERAASCACSIPIGTEVKLFRKPRCLKDVREKDN